MLLLLLSTVSVQAESVLMARSYQDYKVTLESVKKALEARGYSVTHEQRCDGGMKGMGYETDLYRVLFFGKADEVRHWSTAYPEMVPYLPLKIAVIAEGEQVLVVSFNPEEIGLLFPDEELKIQFSRWKNDIDSVLAEVGK